MYFIRDENPFAPTSNSIYYKHLKHKHFWNERNKLTKKKIINNSDKRN